jgi:hypothetical protein
MASFLINLSAQQPRKAASIRERIEELEKQLASVLGVAASTAAVAPAPKPKRRISKAARAALSRRLKLRWAKAKAAGKKAL